MPSTNPKYAIGIDLGTTYCSVAVFVNGRVKVIEDGQGNRRIPSYVAFTDHEYLVGFLAKAQATGNPSNTVHGVKRLLGLTYDEEVESDMTYWPFTVINEGGKPKIKVQYKNEKRIFCPEQITALILTELKEMAETYTGEGGASDIVISVPAKFDHFQRKAILDAANIAGLNVLELINESTAAATAYCTEKKITDTRNLMIFNLGGGSFDVSMVSIQNGELDVKAVSGETHLGGEDFVNNLLRHVAKHFKQNENTDITNKKFLARLKEACEVAKKELSKLPETRIHVDGCDHQIKMNAEKFNQYNENLYTTMMEHARKVLTESMIHKDNFIILLVGGCTRIPKIEELLKTEFSGVRISKGINRDEAVAYGAAVHASKIPRNDIPSSVGKMPRNTPENPLETYLVPINESTPRPEEDVTVRIPSTDNNVLQPTQSSDEENVEKNGLSKEDIEEMKDIALNLKNDCSIYKDQMRCRNDLEGYIIKIQSEFINVAMNSEIMAACDETLDWMSSNEQAAKEDYESQQKDLETLRKKVLKAVRTTSSLPSNAARRSTFTKTGHQSSQSSTSTYNYYTDVPPQTFQQEQPMKGSHSSPKRWFNKDKKPKSSKRHDANDNASSSRLSSTAKENISETRDKTWEHAANQQKDKAKLVKRDRTTGFCSFL